MRNLIVDIIIELEKVNNTDFNMQKDGICTLLKMILNGDNFNIILEAELRNALSPVLLYSKLVKNIDSKNEKEFEIFARAYSETVTNLNHFINYTESDREKYITKIYKGLK